MSKNKQKKYSFDPLIHKHQSLSDNPAESAIAVETRMRVRAAVSKLPDKYKESLWICVLADRQQTVRNAAARLSISPATIYNRANKSIELLKKILESEVLF